MNYLLNKRKRNKKIALASGVFIFILVFILSTTRTLSPLGGIFDWVATPFWRTGNWVSSSVNNFRDSKVNKNKLIEENEILNSQILSMQATMIELEAIAKETDSLLEIFGRSSQSNIGLLAVILSRPPQSPYDTLVIDQGQNNGVVVGDKVFAYGNIPIGFVAEVYNSTSKVTLYSQSKNLTNVVLSDSNLSVDLVGRGGQNFEAILPRDVSVPIGTFASLPSISSIPVAVVSSVISDPRDPFQRILLTSPVNVRYLKYIEIKK